MLLKVQRSFRELEKNRPTQDNLQSEITWKAGKRQYHGQLCFCLSSFTLASLQNPESDHKNISTKQVNGAILLATYLHSKAKQVLLPKITLKKLSQKSFHVFQKVQRIIFVEAIRNHYYYYTESTRRS